MSDPIVGRQENRELGEFINQRLVESAFPLPLSGCGFGLTCGDSTLDDFFVCVKPLSV